MSPYADPARKREWDRDHRRSRFYAVSEATAFADFQMAVLKSLGVVHTREEWAVLRSELRRGRLNTASALAHSREPPTLPP